MDRFISENCPEKIGGNSIPIKDFFVPIVAKDRKLNDIERSNFCGFARLQPKIEHYVLFVIRHSLEVAANHVFAI